MSESLKARLEEARRKAALQKAAAQQQQRLGSANIKVALTEAVAEPVEKKGAMTPPPYEMLKTSNSVAPISLPPLVPTQGVSLNYKGDSLATHVACSNLTRKFLSGKKRSGDDIGEVRLGPCDRQLVDLNAKYDPTCELGKGAYGTVHEAVVLGEPDGTQKTLRAVKEVQERFTKESVVGYPPHLLREFDAVMRLNHPNILHGVELGKSNHTCSVYLITEHGGMNLKDFLFSSRAYMHLSSRNGHPQAAAAVLSKVKCVAKQLLSGLAFLHEHCILHRDLKTANILIDSKGTLRICDFGLARYYKEGDDLTGGVVTLMYRAPEVHFGVSDYSSKIDIWSAGCVIGELLLKAPLFPANQEMEHFRRLCEVLGLPDDSVAFPGMLQLQGAVRLMQEVRGIVPPGGGNQLRSLFANHQWYRGAKECVDDAFVDLLSSLLKWNPKDRPSAREALSHRWFTSSPLPCAPEDLLRPLPTASFNLSSGIPNAAVTSGEQADDEEACAGKQDLEVDSIDHDKRRELLNKGGAEVQVEAEGRTPLICDVDPI